jgi:hypothetical protein
MMNQTYTTLTCNKLGLKKCQPALLIGIFLHNGRGISDNIY